MTDIEKVIKGLECCRIDENGNRHINCADCPYYTDDDKGQMWCSNEINNDAIELLKGQEEREKAICKAICEFIRDSCSTDTDDDKDFVCYEIQRCFTHFGRDGEQE